MANAAQDQRGTFSAHLRNISGASPASPELDRHGDIAGGMSIFDEAVRETERDNRMAEARMAAENAGFYEDHSEFCTHMDAQLETFNYDISEEIADNQDIPAGPHTPTDERLEVLEMDDELPPPSPIREPYADEVHLDAETHLLLDQLNAAEAQEIRQAETPDIPAAQTPPVVDPMEEVEEQETSNHAMEERQPSTSPAPASPPFWLKFVTVPLRTARSRLGGLLLSCLDRVAVAATATGIGLAVAVKGASSRLVSAPACLAGLFAVCNIAFTVFH